jgi:hypothetical protein
VADPKIEKWLRWLEDEIKPEALTMNLQRHVFREVGEIINKHGSLPASYWFDFSSDTYATTQAVAIRRQAEVSTRVISLGRLINEIASDAALVTRKFWVGLWGTSVAVRLGEADRGFTKQFAPGGGNQLDPGIPAADLAQLTRVAGAVKTYVDQHVAHNDAKPRGGLPTFKDLDASIDLIGQLFTKYTNLLTASTWVMLDEPAIQHDWKAIFRERWIK